MLNPHMKAVVAEALLEDAPHGDITSENLIPLNAQASAEFKARESAVMSGVDVLREVFLQIDPEIAVTIHVGDGHPFVPGDTIATVVGNARGILRGERIALNFIQRMCGIATLTSKFVAAVAGTHAQILDTRKTTPGLRMFERLAVVHGGGLNHRFSLSDAVLIKDNHLAVLENAGKDLTTELVELRHHVADGIVIEVEVDHLKQIPAVLAGKADILLLDNFSVDELREGVELVARQALVEASGGVTLETIRGIAETGVDRISVGALTHSVQAVDIGLDITIQADHR